MKAGAMRDRITIQQRSSVQDELTGEISQTWTDVALVWANVQFVNGISAIKAGMDTSSVKASIRMRYRTGIDASMRVLHGTDIYSIEAVMPNKTAGTLDLICKVTNAQS